MKNCIATIGFFDGVHRGHRCLIAQVCEKAKQRSLSSLIVTFDRHPREVIQADYIPQMISTCEEKKLLLKETGADAIEVLHFTKEMSRLTALEFMQQVLHDQLHVKVLVMGYDHRFGHNGGAPQDYIQWGKETGIEVLMAHELPEEKISSSRIRRLLEDGELEKANALLGRCYSLNGIVVEGHRIGRTMGFPTANLKLECGKLIPATGVYAVRATTENEQAWNGVLNIGKRPTIGNGDDLSVEAHLLHFDGDLYGQSLRLELNTRLRSERTFANKEELQQQIANDVKRARKVLSSLDK